MRGPSWTTTVILAAGLTLSACSDRPAGGDAAAPAAPAVQPKAAPVEAVPAPLPPPPPEAAAVDAALKDVQAFNAAAAEELAGIARAEQRIRQQATRALELAGRAGAASEADRRRLSGQVAAARAEAERARAGLTAGLAAFQNAAAERSAQLNGALEPCTGMPTLSAYEPCAALTAEQAVLAQNITALTDRYQAAEAAWRQERAKLDEASAVMALGR